MQKKIADGLKNKRQPSKNKYAEFNEEDSIELLAEIIANRIINKLLYHEKWESTIEPHATGDGKKREAA